MPEIVDPLAGARTGGGEVLDCVVVGAGPAGLTAALYLRRFHRTVRVVDARHSRTACISRSHNCAGFPEGIAGVQLLERMQRHLHDVGGAVIHGSAARVEHGADGQFAVALPQQTLCARNVILCTGVRDREVPLPGFADVATADLLRACPVCDGHEFSGKCIGVVGNSMHGVREAAFLRHFSEDVWFIEIDGGPQGASLDDAVDKARLHRTPGLAQHAAVRPDRRAFVTMDDGSGHAFDVLYAALGVDPATQPIAALGARTDVLGSLLTDAHCRTTVAGLYAAGDVVSGLHQISVAVGQGAIAATAVHNSL